MDMSKMGSSLLKYFTLISACTALFSYGFLTIEETAYLRKFNIDIQSISYWPSLYEMITRAFPAIVAMIISVGLFITIVISMPYISAWVKKLKIRGAKTVGEIFELEVSAGLLTFACVVLVLISLFDTAEKMGAKYAESMTVFTVISDGGENTRKDVLIYQNNNVGVVKTFDSVSARFEDSYRLVQLEGKQFKIEKIR